LVGPDFQQCSRFQPAKPKAHLAAVLCLESCRTPNPLSHHMPRKKTLTRMDPRSYPCPHRKRVLIIKMMETVASELWVVRWEYAPGDCLDSRRIAGIVRAPHGSIRLNRLGRIGIAIADTFSQAVVNHCESRRTPISCTKGCGACCRDAVPLSPPEAWMIRDLVQSLPSAERERVQGRFLDARESLRKHGLEQEPLLSLGGGYFRVGIACPFLHQECCSIHPDRPAVCREHLVHSPPHLCLDPENAIEFAPIPVRISECLAWVAGTALGTAPTFIPVVRALDWAADLEKEGRRRWESLSLVESLLHRIGARILDVGKQTAETRCPADFAY